MSEPHSIDALRFDIAVCDTRQGEEVLTRVSAFARGRLRHILSEALPDGDVVIDTLVVDADVVRPDALEDQLERALRAAIAGISVSTGALRDAGCAAPTGSRDGEVTVLPGQSSQVRSETGAAAVQPSGNAPDADPHPQRSVGSNDSDSASHRSLDRLAFYLRTGRYSDWPGARAADLPTLLRRAVARDLAGLSSVVWTAIGDPAGRTRLHAGLSVRDWRFLRDAAHRSGATGAQPLTRYIDILDLGDAANADAGGSRDPDLAGAGAERSPQSVPRTAQGSASGERDPLNTVDMSPETTAQDPEQDGTRVASTGLEGSNDGKSAKDGGQIARQEASHIPSEADAGSTGVDGRWRTPGQTSISKGNHHPTEPMSHSEPAGLAAPMQADAPQPRGAHRREPPTGPRTSDKMPSGGTGHIGPEDQHDARRVMVDDDMLDGVARACRSDAPPDLASMVHRRLWSLASADRALEPTALKQHPRKAVTVEDDKDAGSAGYPPEPMNEGDSWPAGLALLSEPVARQLLARAGLDPAMCDTTLKDAEAALWPGQPHYAGADRTVLQLITYLRSGHAVPPPSAAACLSGLRNIWPGGEDDTAAQDLRAVLMRLPLARARFAAALFTAPSARDVLVLKDGTGLALATLGAPPVPARIWGDAWRDAVIRVLVGEADARRDLTALTAAIAASANLDERDVRDALRTPPDARTILSRRAAVSMVLRGFPSVEAVRVSELLALAEDAEGRIDADRLAPLLARETGTDETQTRLRVAEYTTTPEHASETAVAGGEIGTNMGGLTLLWPFLARYFEEAGLTEGGAFRASGTAHAAIHHLSFLASGRTDWAEHELSLHKLLVGLPLDAPVPPQTALDPAMIEGAEALLRRVTASVPAFQNTDITALRDVFLMREGVFFRDSQGATSALKITAGPFDMLLGQVPWPLSPVRLLWMPAPLTVRWT
ncbi:contractile injection system tape measure protein [uncultured Roseobacter sp.]|uniref:contractile injection system tape measure protein n=1 Tax=uncultured Roseobacter sp. TaxID=114847 RepID=UPI002607EDD9|nr:contractile injection system tape measure protein [uncultured Roseobacter sp.]